MPPQSIDQVSGRTNFWFPLLLSLPLFRIRPFIFRVRIDIEVNGFASEKNPCPFFFPRRCIHSSGKKGGRECPTMQWGSDLDIGIIGCKMCTHFLPRSYRGGQKKRSRRPDCGHDIEEQKQKHTRTGHHRTENSAADHFKGT